MPKKEVRGDIRKSLSNDPELYEWAEWGLKWKMNKNIFSLYVFLAQSSVFDLKRKTVIFYIIKKSRKMIQIKLFIIQFHILENLFPLFFFLFVLL